MCRYALGCFLNMLNYGLRQGGGIGDAIKPVSYDEDRFDFFFRVLYDLSFFIIIIILLLNLIFGMIIDAFGDLRDQKTRNDDDQKNVCFICGIERSELERHMNFEDHINEEHNTWSYVYYLVYILEMYHTARNEMTDIENTA